MNRRNISRVRATAHGQALSREKIRVLLTSLICIGVVAAGFFFAARQHFATMEFGLKNSQLRKQVENLEAEHRRLILAKEMSLSPAAIKETASKLGFRERIAAPPSASETRVIRTTEAATPSVELTSMKTGTATQATVAKSTNEKKLVKTIVQQAKIKTQLPNERPRIAATEAVAASLTKPAKLR